MKVIEVANAK